MLLYAVFFIYAIIVIAHRLPQEWQDGQAVDKAMHDLE